jgi:hypothetical protein
MSIYSHTIDTVLQRPIEFTLVTRTARIPRPLDDSYPIPFGCRHLYSSVRFSCNLDSIFYLMGSSRRRLSILRRRLLARLN